MAVRMSSESPVRLAAAGSLIQHVIDGHVPLNDVAHSIIRLIQQAQDAEQEQAE